LAFFESSIDSIILESASDSPLFFTNFSNFEILLRPLSEAKDVNNSPTNSPLSSAVEFLIASTIETTLSHYSKNCLNYIYQKNYFKSSFLI